MKITDMFDSDMFRYAAQAYLRLLKNALYLLFLPLWEFKEHMLILERRDSEA